MFIENTSFKINGTDISNYVIDIEYNYPKLWSSNSGRSLSGKFSGVLLGIYPKFVVQFKPLSQNELKTISKLLDSPRQTIRYYDPNKEMYKTTTTYSGDWAVKCKNINQNESFTISFISVDKRG